MGLKRIMEIKITLIYHLMSLIIKSPTVLDFMVNIYFIKLKLRNNFQVISLVVCQNHTVQYNSSTPKFSRHENGLTEPI